MIAEDEVKLRRNSKIIGFVQLGFAIISAQISITLIISIYTVATYDHIRLELENGQISPESIFVFTFLSARTSIFLIVVGIYFLCQLLDGFAAWMLIRSTQADLVCRTTLLKRAQGWKAVNIALLISYVIAFFVFVSSSVTWTLVFPLLKIAARGIFLYVGSQYTKLLTKPSLIEQSIQSSTGWLYTIPNSA